LFIKIEKNLKKQYQKIFIFIYFNNNNNIYIDSNYLVESIIDYRLFNLFIFVLFLNLYNLLIIYEFLYLLVINEFLNFFLINFYFIVSKIKICKIILSY